MARRDDVILGAPCWINLTTSDVEKASVFYGKLFGWTGFDTGEDFDHYTLMNKGDAHIAGVSQADDDTPAFWGIYLAVQDAAATIEAARNAGGQTLIEPMELGDLGNLGVLSDPSGAVIGAWQANQHRGFGLYGEHGAPAWFELMTLDFPAAAAFYEQVFGVTLADEDMGEGGPTYKTMNVDGEPYAGMMDATGQMPEGVPSNWMVYFSVDDTDAAITKAKELGGSVMAPAADSPYGRFALLADPSGATFAIIS